MTLYLLLTIIVQFRGSLLGIISNALGFKQDGRWLINQLASIIVQYSNHLLPLTVSTTQLLHRQVENLVFKVFNSSPSECDELSLTCYCI